MIHAHISGSSLFHKPQLLSQATLFPYTTLFRSRPAMLGCVADDRDDHRADEEPRKPGGLRKALEGVHENLADEGGCARRSEEHTSELQSQFHLECRHLLDKKKVLYHAHKHQGSL